jgi:hypothetical protein
MINWTKASRFNFYGRFALEFVLTHGKTVPKE